MHKLDANQCCSAFGGTSLAEALDIPRLVREQGSPKRNALHYKGMRRIDAEQLTSFRSQQEYRVKHRGNTLSHLLAMSHRPVRADADTNTVPLRRLNTLSLMSIRTSALLVDLVLASRPRKVEGTVIPILAAGTCA